MFSMEGIISRFLVMLFAIWLTTEEEWLGCSYAQHHQQHIVGDFMWSIPPTNDFYINWSSNGSFLLGDSLVFRFETGFYNVVQVSRREYESCTTENPFRTILTGPAVVSLDEDGVYYYICSFGNYCHLGQKLYVAVSPPSS